MKKLLIALSLGIFASTAMALQPDASIVKKGRSDRQAKSRIEITTLESALNARQLKKSNAPQQRAAAKATSLEGMCIYPTRGWYSVVAGGTAVEKWGLTGGANAPSAGFVRNNEIYSFYHTVATDYTVVSAGVEVLDLATGAVKEKYPENVFDSAVNVVLLSAYDSESDIAYVVTYTKSGSGYTLQKFDPKTKSYTDLGVSVSSDWLDMGWNPADKCAYILTENGILMRYDSKGKRFVQANTLSYDMTDYPNDMVYSPKDEAFIVAIDSYDYDDYPCTDIVLLPVSGRHQYVGTVSGNPQYSILYIPDTYVNATAPKAPVLKSWDVAGAALSGSFTVTLPTQLESGTAIDGKVYIEATADGTAIGGSYSGAAGATVTIPVSGTEGVHEYAVTPYLLGNDGKVYGSVLKFTRCLGNDTPEKPQGVTLSETKVTWKASTKGIYMGYIDPAAVTYDVYIDKVKMNSEPVSGTSLDITLPATGVVAHVAEVYASFAGNVSEPGVSAKFYSDGALSLPVYLGPDEGADDMDADMIDLFTTVKDLLNTESLRGWRYDDQSEHTGGFYCLAPKASTTGDTSNEWLFLPAINFPDKDGFYKLTMDVWSGNHYFTTTETFEIALCPGPSSRGAVIIQEPVTIYKNPYFEQSETLFQVPEAGEWYIGIHYISPVGSYRLYARNFRVEQPNSEADSPEAVENLKSTAAPDGVLKAILTFNMPTKSIAGNTLDPTAPITAKAVSKGGEASVQGTPGQAMTLEVPTVQGDNIITVSTSSAKGEGKLAETVVYCGVYEPAKPIVTPVTAPDNMSLTLEIDLEPYNDNGQFTGPDDQEVIIYRKISDQWREAANIGRERTWTFECPANAAQDVYYFAVGAANAAGECDGLSALQINLGPLYSLPMKETYRTVNDNLKLEYTPFAVEGLSYLASTWAYGDPTIVDPDAANESGCCIAATYDGESLLHLPRFTTLGMNNVKLDLCLYFGNNTAENVTVFATSPALEMEPVATFTPKSGSGWEHKLVSLPKAFQNQPWVQIYIRVKIVGYSQWFMMESYAIANYPDDMVTISGISGASRGAVGEQLNYSVEIENAGVKDVAMPGYTFKVLGDNGIIGDLTAADAPATLATGKKATLNFNFTPKGADAGDVLVRFSLEGQPAQAVSEIEKQVKVLTARIPVVDDLAASVSEGSSDVTLSWSRPVFTEDFEAADTWSYGETIRNFRNIDLDEARVWTITEVDFPGEGSPKAFQVFNASVTQNMSMAANSGEQYLLCMSPKSGETNDWLISPEVKGGSDVSFWMNICGADYPETVLVKYSTTGNNPADFKAMVDDGYICPDEAKWAKYEFTLPDNARYFAIQHVGDDGNEQFGLMIDDIAYVAAADDHSIESYNVYRDDALVGTGVTAESFVDKGAYGLLPARYYVKSVATLNGEKVESDRSNVIWATGDSFVDEIPGGAATIIGGHGEVIIKGFAAGIGYTVSNVAGMTVANGETAGEVESCALSAGIYIVRCGSFATKVVVD